MKDLVLAAAYAAFLALCSALLARSAAAIVRKEAAKDGRLPWPQSDAAALRRVMAATLQVLAAFVVTVAAYRALHN
jgi:hypothetical protein